MLIIRLRVELIKAPQKSSETLVHATNRCLQPCKLGVVGNLRGLHLPNLLIYLLLIIINPIGVLPHLLLKMLRDALGTRCNWSSIILVFIP